MATDPDRIAILHSEINQANQEGRTSDAAAVSRELQRLNANPSPTTFMPSGSQPGQTSSVPTQIQTQSISQPIASSIPTQSYSDIADYISGQAGQLKQATDKEQQSASTAATMGLQNATAVADRNYQNEQIASHLRDTFGLNAADPSNLAATTSAALKVNDQRYQQAKGEYDEIASRSLVDDPLSWIMGRLQMPAAAAKVNAAAQNDRMLQSMFERNITLDTDAQTHITLDQSATNKAIALGTALQQFQVAQANIAAMGVDAAKAGMQAGALTMAGMRDAAIIPTQVKLMQENLNQKEAQDQMNIATGKALGLPGPVTDKFLKDLAPNLRQQVAEFSATGMMSPETRLVAGRALLNDPTGQGQLQYEAAQKSDRQIRATMQALQRQDQLDGRRRSQQELYNAAWLQMQDQVSDGATNMQPSKTVNDIHRDLMSPTNDSDFNPYRADLSGFMTSQAQIIRAGQNPTVTPNNVMFRTLAQAMKSGSAVINAQGTLSTIAEKNSVIGIIDNQVAGNWNSDGKPVADTAIAKQIAEFYNSANDYTQNRTRVDQIGFPPVQNYVARLTLPKSTLMGSIYQAGSMPVDLRNPASIAEYISAYRKSLQLNKAYNDVNPHQSFGMYN